MFCCIQLVICRCLCFFERIGSFCQGTKGKFPIFIRSSRRNNCTIRICQGKCSTFKGFLRIVLIDFLDLESCWEDLCCYGIWLTVSLVAFGLVSKLVMGLDYTWTSTVVFVIFSTFLHQVFDVIGQLRWVNNWDTKVCFATCWDRRAFISHKLDTRHLTVVCYSCRPDISISSLLHSVTCDARICRVVDCPAFRGR